MKEADFKRCLVADLKNTMPGCVVVRHEDKFRAGVPDLSVTWRGTTSWIEVKYERAGRRSRLTELQAATLDALARAGAPAYALTYHEAKGAKETILLRYTGEGEAEVAVHYAGARWGHGDVAAAVRGDHERRAGQ